MSTGYAHCLDYGFRLSHGFHKSIKGAPSAGPSRGGTGYGLESTAERGCSPAAHARRLRLPPCEVFRTEKVFQRNYIRKQKRIPSRIDAGRRLGSVVRHPACCFEWLGAQQLKVDGTRPSSCPSPVPATYTAAPFSPRSPRMPPTVPGAGEGSGARQQLHISSKQLRQRRPWFSPRTAFIAEAKVLIMHPTAALGPLPDNTHAPPNHPAVPVHRRSTGGATLDGHRREFDAVRGACARLEQAPAPTLARCIVP